MLSRNRNSRLLLFFITVVSLFILVKSNVGLAVMALRSSEPYAISRGINPFKYKSIVIIVSGFFTGLIGAFYAHFLGVIGPEILGWNFVVIACCIVMLGGPGTLYGPIVAAFLITILSTYLAGLEAYKYLIIAAVMLIIVLRYPSGIAGSLSTFKSYTLKLRKSLPKKFLSILVRDK